MKTPISLALGALLAASAALVGCADHSLVSPVAPRADAVLEEVTDAGPDSGEVFVSAIAEAGETTTFHTMSLAAVPAAVPTARDIRIGVVPSGPSTVTLGSTADYTIADKASGQVLMTGTNGAATVKLVAAPPSYYRLQVSCLGAAATATKLAAAQAAGYVTFTEFVPAANCTRLFLGEFAPPPANTFGARTTFRNQAMAGGFAGTDSFWKVVSVLGSPTYTVTRGVSSVTTVNPIVVTSSSGIVTIAGLPYRGKGEARMNGTSTLAGINELPLERYLYGVVPRELPPSVWPQPEAQKAQAVAARTYAMRGYGKRASDGYDLLPTTSDQVYGGYSAEQPVSNAAVDATRGVVATYEGNLIDALFSSTSGGFTANSEEAFSYTPYLRGVPDAERGAALDRVPTLDVFKNGANPTSLRATKQGDFEADWSRYHRWTFEWTNAEITDVLSTSFGKPVGRVLAINVLERGPSGRALDVEYVTENGTFHSFKDGSTRGTLKYIDAAGKPQSLLSTLFYIEPVTDPKTKETVGFRAYGGGWGHGVGLSQTGAAGMAQRGHTYDEILKHYYTGIELTQPAVSAVP